jgi:hypothetical protein
VYSIDFLAVTVFFATFFGAVLRLAVVAVFFTAVLRVAVLEVFFLIAIITVCLFGDI